MHTVLRQNPAKKERSINLLWILLLLLLLSGGLYWLWPLLHRPHYVNLPPPATGPWVAFGDSLTEGYGASEGHDYPTVLGQHLGRKIVNLGRSGATTSDGLSRLPEVLDLKPQVVLLCFGGNDGLERLSRERMFSNLGEIIDRLHVAGSFVVLIGIRSTTLRDQNEKGFRQLAKDKKVFYVPNILHGIFLKPVYMSDAVHPNDDGYRLIAERLEKDLQPVIRKLER